VQIFTVIRTQPFPAALTVLVIVLVAIFFVTGADSASLVMGKFSQNGAIAPSRWVIVFWGVATGAVAAIMLVSGGADALEGIQNLTFLASVPFALIMVLMCVSLSKDLRSDELIRHQRRAQRALATLAATEQRDER
jgi:choline-glycine betaine transporter